MKIVALCLVLLIALSAVSAHYHHNLGEHNRMMSKYAGNQIEKLGF